MCNNVGLEAEKGEDIVIKSIPFDCTWDVELGLENTCIRSLGNNGLLFILE